MRPLVVALDVIETTFTLEPLAVRFEAAGLPRGTLRLFFAQMLRDAFALEASGVYRPFRQIAAANLEVFMASHGVPPEASAVDQLLAGFAELPAHPDAMQALAQLRDAGVRVIALTNGSAANTGTLLSSSGLDAYVERVVSIDEVQRWKPNREVYLHAARVCGVEPGRVALIAAHAWDVHGAKQAGLLGAWVMRQDRRYHPAMSQPDVSGETMTEVAAALAALPG